MFFLGPACHGLDDRGSVLSRSFAARTLTTESGTRQLSRGSQVSCDMCHNGPSSESATSTRPPVATSLSTSTLAGTPVSIHLLATDPDGNALTGVDLAARFPYRTRVVIRGVNPDGQSATSSFTCRR